MTLWRSVVAHTAIASAFVFFLTPSLASADGQYGVGKTGQSKTIVWTVSGGAGGCTGATSYPSTAGDGVYSAWSVYHSGSGSLTGSSWTAPGGNYSFDCNLTDTSGGTVATDRAWLAVVPAPTVTSATCDNAGHVTINGSGPSGLPPTTYFPVRIDDLNDSTMSAVSNGACISPGTVTSYNGDYCFDTVLTAFPITGNLQPGHTYNIWIHAFNNGGWSPAVTINNGSFTCPAVGTLSATPNPCTIPSGASNCSPGVSVTFTTNTSLSTVWVGNSTFMSGTGATSAPVSWIAYGSNVFTLRDGNTQTGTTLATLTVTGNCASGSTWNGSICAASACANGANNPTACNTCTSPQVYNTSSASCVNPLSVSTGGNLTNTLPTTAFTETYTLTNGSGATCRLLDSTQTTVLVAYASCTGSISYNAPSSAGTYGYYLQVFKSATNETKTVNFTVTESSSPTYTISASAGTGGTISPSGSVSVTQGNNQSFSISANSGYTISSVTVDGVNQGAISSYTFTNVQTSHTISASFSAVASTFTITATAGTGGTISPSGSVSVTQGNNQSFSITANSGYAINAVSVDGINQGAISSYTFTNVQGGHTISATFSASASCSATPVSWTYSGSASAPVSCAGTTGTVSPSTISSTNGNTGTATFTCTSGSWGSATNQNCCPSSYTDTAVVGSTAGTVWGSSPYTDDSDLGTAAVHAGLISAGQSATIHRTPAGYQSSFTSTTANGVTTTSYTGWCGATLSVVSAATPSGSVTVGGAKASQAATTLIKPAGNTIVAGSNSYSTTVKWTTSNVTPSDTLYILKNVDNPAGSANTPGTLVSQINYQLTGTYPYADSPHVINSSTSYINATAISGSTGFSDAVTYPESRYRLYDGTANTVLVDALVRPTCAAGTTWDSTSGMCISTTCPASTISNCSVNSTGSGGVSGTCASGYTNTCSYTCNNGTWGTPSSNTCVPAVGCAFNTNSSGTAVTTNSGSYTQTNPGDLDKNTNATSGGTYCWGNNGSNTYFVPQSTSAEFQSFWTQVLNGSLPGLYQIP